MRVVLTYFFLFYEDISNGGIGGVPGDKSLWERFNNWLDADTFLIDVTAVRHACSAFIIAVLTLPLSSF